MKTRIAWIQTHEWEDGDKREVEIENWVIAFSRPYFSKELWQKVVVIPVEED